MSVTVLLPVYNGAPTLAAAIDSILGQDDSDFELLVIDDASKDASAEVAASFAEQDSRVRFVRHPENRGLAATLNEGLEIAETELVLRMDQDDVALPQRIRVQRAFMAQYPHIAVAGSDVFHMGRDPSFDRLVSVPHTPRDVARRLQTENCMYHPSVVLRVEAIRELGGYRASFRNAEDYDLWLRVSRKHDMANLAEPLLRYRFSVEGMTLSRKWEQLFYVHLAQAANRDPAAPFAELKSAARTSVAAVDRRWFMRQVATGTIDELLRLGLHGDARRVLRGFSGEVGLVASTRLTGRIAASFARELGGAAPAKPGGDPSRPRS